MMPRMRLTSLWVVWVTYCGTRLTRVCLWHVVGPYACVGKRLAMLELRRVVGEILLRYDLTVAPGQTKQGFLDGKQDTFTTVSAPLPVIFTERAHAV